MKNRIYLWVIIPVFVLFSCYEDKGNYNYEELAAISIAKLPERINSSRGEILDVVPRISIYGDSLMDSERYSYHWEAKTALGTSHTYELGEERNLYYTMNLPSKEYRLILTVTDNETGLKWYQDTRLDVTGSISEGWLFMTEQIDESGDRLADLSVYAYSYNDKSFRLLNNILEISGFPYRKGPRKVCSNTHHMAGKLVYILTDEAIGWVDHENYMWESDRLLKYQMMESVPNSFTGPELITNGYLSQNFLFSEGGGFHAKANMTLGPIFGINAAYTVEGGKKNNLDLAPFIGSPMNLVGTVHLLFDRKSKRFITCTFANTTANDLTMQPVVDSWGNTEREMICMHSVGELGDVYAILKDKAGKFYRYAFTVSKSTILLKEINGIVELNAPHLSEALPQNIAFNQAYGDLYFAAGGNLYTYRDNQEVLVKQFDQPISVVESNYLFHNNRHAAYKHYMEFTKYIVVATYDTDSETGETISTIYFYLPEVGRPEVLQTVDRIQVPGKVVDVNYQIIS